MRAATFADRDQAVQAARELDVRASGAMGRVLLSLARVLR
ncbi:hypothetical protein M878_25465 [Streptomyces roseochromogenus subsp. oscitans DS 12.976]|uniref:Uncharacterized protein n=1 Tax=Streptomyces roseochromogenus subsp. oscitans DS 12.976 TaxID=1352936 RepID=V6K590_STRRC|nr:hypothetical protein M878_25465 [Streptomyces roseochromogenus subsp. oscitans DS 12.976]